MLDIDRRTVLVGSLLATGSVKPALAALQDSTNSPRMLQLRLCDFFGLNANTASLLAERLQWRGDWPALVVTRSRFASVENLSEQQSCRSTQSSSSLLAIYSSRLREVSTWRRVGGTDAVFFGVQMAAYRFNGHLACIVQPEGATLPRHITLKV